MFLFLFWGVVIRDTRIIRAITWTTRVIQDHQNYHQNHHENHYAQNLTLVKLFKIVLTTLYKTL